MEKNTKRIKQIRIELRTVRYNYSISFIGELKNGLI